MYSRPKFLRSLPRLLPGSDAINDTTEWRDRRSTRITVPTGCRPSSHLSATMGVGALLAFGAIAVAATGVGTTGVPGATGQLASVLQGTHRLPALTDPTPVDRQLPLGEWGGHDECGPAPQLPTLAPGSLVAGVIGCGRCLCSDRPGGHDGRRARGPVEFQHLESSAHRDADTVRTAGRQLAADLR